MWFGGFAEARGTISSQLRSELGIIPGSEVDISNEGDRFVIVIDPIGELKNNWRGKFKGQQSSGAYLEFVTKSTCRLDQCTLLLSFFTVDIKQLVGTRLLLFEEPLLLLAAAAGAMLTAAEATLSSPSPSTALTL